MQNFVIAALAWTWRLLRACLKRATNAFVLPTPAGAFNPGAVPLCVDLDSARLDAVSRSLLWGTGVLAPEPTKAAVCSPPGAASPLRSRIVPPERFRRIEP
jgi:hypothetical protein